MSPHFDVLGTRINAVTMRQVLDEVERRVTERRPAFLVFCTVSTVLEARTNPSAKRAVQNATIVTPDGMPLVWIGRRRGLSIDRVYGPDFMLALMEVSGSKFKHYFYGGHSGVAEEMVSRLRGSFPSLRVAGHAAPRLGLDAEHPPDEDINRINDARPDIVWVGLGHPKQEIWMHANRDRIDAPILAGVGAAFDFLSGRKKEAPKWMQKSGLQWLHRLLSEPKRLWRRYLIGNTVFIALLLRERMFRRWTLPRN